MTAKTTDSILEMMDFLLEKWWTLYEKDEAAMMARLTWAPLLTTVYGPAQSAATAKVRWAPPDSGSYLFFEIKKKHHASMENHHFQ